MRFGNLNQTTFWFGSMCKCDVQNMNVFASFVNVVGRSVFLQILSELKQCRLPWIQEPLSAEDQQGRPDQRERVWRGSDGKGRRGRREGVREGSDGKGSE